MQSLSTNRPTEVQPTPFLQARVSPPCANAACLRRHTCGRVTLRGAILPYAAEATISSSVGKSSSVTLR